MTSQKQRAKIRIEELVEYLIKKIRENLSAQGHNLTGRLSRSLEGKESESGDAWAFSIFWEAYGTVIEQGLNRSRVPYSPGSGAKHSKFIEGLIKYVKLRGLRPRKGQTVKGIAFAIAASGKKVGFPLPGSRRFSSTGRRTGAISEVLDNEKRAILLGITEAAAIHIEDYLSGILEEVADSRIIEIVDF